MLSNFENYGPFCDLVKHGIMELDVNNINVSNYMDYFNGILNIMKDGIELEAVQRLKVKVNFADGEYNTFTLTELWFNLIFWTVPIYLGIPLTFKYIFNARAITKNNIRNYFNKAIKKFDSSIDFVGRNILIDECLYKFKEVDSFSMFLANTVNFHDSIELMRRYPEFNEAMHADLTGVPIEEVKNVGMEYTRTQIKIIKESDHCLKDSFIAGEAISPKQFKEVSVSIGTKPDGQGSVYPYIVNKNFMNGGVDEPESYVIDSSVGRTAQILQKMNVGTSGSFARLLETNNIDTFFNDDPNYSCNTRNFIKVYIEDASWLNIYDGRYYRFSKNGIEYCLDKDRDTHLIGQTLLFRSPITCNSFAHGHGICRKCYGRLYDTNRDINPGKIAAELLSSLYTQMLLSAKHLLESSVVEMKWNPEFNDIFETNLNMIKVSEDADTTGMKMILDSSLFDSSEDSDDDSGVAYDEYTPSFDIKYPDGHIVHFHTANEDSIYLTEDINRILKSKKAKEEDGIYTVPVDILKSIPCCFTFKIQNKELQRTLERSKHIINRSKDTSSFNKDTIVREFISANAEGGIHINAIHLEVIIANQMRDPENIMDMPNWGIEDAPYKILTLSSALDNSPSITVNLEYQKIGKTLASPLSTKKHKPSVMDLFFMEQPQQFVVSKDMISDNYKMIEDTAASNVREAVYFEEEDADDESCF